MLFDFVFEGFGRGFWKWGENWHVGKFSSWVELPLIGLYFFSRFDLVTYGENLKLVCSLDNSLKVSFG